MIGPAPFTFGIPLLARVASSNWELVERLLSLTLKSLAAQYDPCFDVVIAGHDRPMIPGHFSFLEAGWPAEPVRADNLDSGRKKALLADHVGRRNGHLMFLDADDWVDVRLVSTARACLPLEATAGGAVGGVIAAGYAVDLRNRRVLPVPHPDAFAGGFHELCGSSTVAILDPDAEEAVRRDPYSVLHEHYRWEERCRAHGLESLRLDLVGAYVVNTAANHSTSYGPFADWRRRFDGQVALGAPLDDDFLARFGLTLRDLDGVCGRTAASASKGVAPPL